MILLNSHKKMYKSFSLQARIGSTPYYIICIAKTKRHHSPYFYNSDSSEIWSVTTVFNEDLTVGGYGVLAIT